MSEKQETIEVHRFNAEKLGMPFYVDVGTSVVAVRCTSNHDVIWRADHGLGGKSWIDEAKRICARMNEEAQHSVGNGAKMREALAAFVQAYELDDELANIEETSIAYHKALEALAEPPRNCDKYALLDEARNAYMAINEMPEGNRDEDVRRWLCDFHNWLFTPATEKEGGEQ